MLLERLLDGLALRVEPFARCHVGSGACLELDGLGWVTLHVVLQGEGELRAPAGWAAPLRPGMLALVPTRMPHSMRAGDGRTVTVAHDGAAGDGGGLRQLVAGAGILDDHPDGSDALVVACGELQVLFAGGPGLFDLLTEPLVEDLSDSDETMGWIRRMLEESGRAEPGQRAMLTALMHACLVELFRRLCRGGDCGLPWLEALEDPHLGAALRVLLEHPERDHTVDSLAAAAAMSRSAFAERFTARFGQTPKALLRDVRLRRGARLLQDSGLPVATIARRVGFASRSHFSRAFRDRFDVSPSQFRAGA